MPLINGSCSTINCTYQDMKIPSEDIVEIVSFNMIEQLRLLIKHNIDLLRRYQAEARNLTTADANDIVRADIYQSILKVRDDFFVSIMIHSDGIPLYKSKNCNAWPILGAVLELPPFARTRADNILLLAIWIGKKKPNFDVVFKRLANQFSTLRNEGVQISEREKIKVVFPMLMGDMPALSAMVQFVEPHAFYACMFCDTKGTYSHEGHCITYPIDNSAELRTSDNFKKCARLAASMQPRIDRERTIGIKGLSSFFEILDVPLPHSVVIDAMHTVFLCHSKKLLIQLQTSISKENLLKISQKLHSINYIHDILRRPRSFSNVHKWKASEVRTFILYIGLPVLVEFLSEDDGGHLALYIIILRLLHDYWENDKQLSDAISSLLRCYMKTLSEKVESHQYPPKLLTISTHTHLHLPLQCKKFGRLDWLTNFVFENFLGYLKAFVKGSCGAGDQIAFAFVSNFVLPKTQKQENRSFGHFLISKNIFGSDIAKLRDGDPFIKFLCDHQYATVNSLFFSRLHYVNVTYHSFLHERKGSACSYLVCYEKENVLCYGYILAFLLKDGICSVVLQTLTRLNHSLTSCFPSYVYLTAMKDFIDDLYIVFKRVQPSFFDFDHIDICSVTSLRSRCFSIPFRDDLRVITKYSCAYEHN